jgi:hypothetical protein
MSLRKSRGLGTISRSASFVGWIRSNLVFDTMTIGILAFVIVLTLVVFAATTTVSTTNCQAICQVHT